MKYYKVTFKKDMIERMRTQDIFDFIYASIIDSTVNTPFSYGFS